MSDPLAAFSAPVRVWFEESFGQPTPPQAAGWPAIQRGDHTLILAPTGSGKTLAAFLWGIDEIGRALAEEGADVEPGVRLLYISPLKALNNDIERNLRAPLAGIRRTAERLEAAATKDEYQAVTIPSRAWPRIHVAVRTGDTPASARAGMVKHPPHILITTPESLYLILTSPRAQEMLRTVRTVIVDEIHTLVGDKRGAHLAISLERLTHLTGRDDDAGDLRLQRIGLSATIRPLEEAARFLGGQEPFLPSPAGTRAEGESRPRPVTIINTGYRKPMELEVVTPVNDFREMPADSIWPSVIPQVLGDIMRHRTTLIFTNNRRLAERTADRLNVQIAAERSEEIPPGSPEALAPGGVMRGKGIFAIGAEGPIRAHHGSMSKERRRAMEEDLKDGKLPALVGTSSLELGIDIGSVDLVVQLQSPKSVSQGLQRVGRSGHLVGQTSRGKIYATFREDLVEAAAVARGMLEGDVEPTRAPRAPLDVLAQQVLAMVAAEPWPEQALYALVRRAYPYRDLSPEDFAGVLAMLSGKWAALGVPHPSLQPRVAWDRANGMLYPLPGTRLLALGNPGTITDRGAYDVVLADGTTRVGQLDEEFVFESRAGDAFILGSTVWRILEIKDDRIMVGDAAGASPRMPFWRGDYPWRPYELGTRIARLRRAVAERLRAGEQETGGEGEPGDTTAAASSAAVWPPSTPAPQHSGSAATLAWLRSEYVLDERSARNLLDYLSRQLDVAGEIAADDAIVVEAFTDAVGEGRVVVHSPFGGRVNGAWALALSDALRDRLGFLPETQANDDGILFRMPAGVTMEPVVEVLRALDASEARARLLRALPDSALFGAHFRMNAARALLLPRARAGKRTPFWLQRLKARDLLALVRNFPDFPLIVETTRECLEDALDVPHLEELLDGIQDGSVRVSAVETAVPSPVAAGLLMNFVSTFMYEWDAPKAERQLLELAWQAEAPGAGAPAGALLRDEAVAEVTERAAHTGPQRGARTADELAVILEQLGDLSESEALARVAGDEALGRTWLDELAAVGRVVLLELPAARLDLRRRYVASEMAPAYRAAFGDSAAQGFPAILRRFIAWAGPVSEADIHARYPGDPAWLKAELARLEAAREIVRFGAGEPPIYLDARLYDQARRRTIALLRREIRPVGATAYAAFLAQWQRVTGARGQSGAAGVRAALEQMRGIALPVAVWDREVLPARVPGYTPADLVVALGQGGLAWAASGRDPRRARVCFFPRGEGRLFLGEPDATGLSAPAQAVYAFLNEEGASPPDDIESGLGMPATTVRAALVELALAELVTADSAAALGAVLGFEAPAAPQTRPMSALEADLAARRTRPAHIVRAIDHHRRAPRHSPLRRLPLPEPDLTGAPEAVDPWAGRWSLLHRAGVLGAPRGDEALSEAQARVLLARYGVLTRESVQREAGQFEWAALAGQLTRLELRGEVRRGYFVAGFWGVQYALPDAVEQLRAAAKSATPDG